ncbi:MAG: hypothetical protein WC588_04640, partial [Candidatus Micrarchaeia archaeon]
MPDGHIGIKNEKRAEIPSGNFQTALSYLTVNEREAYFVIHAYSSSFNLGPGLQPSDIEDNGRTNFLEILGFEKCSHCNILPGEKCYFKVVNRVDRRQLQAMDGFQSHQAAQVVHENYRKFANGLQSLFDAMSKIDSQLYNCGFELPYGRLKMLPTGQTASAKAYSPGSQYLLYTDLLEIFKSAKTDVLVLEAYPDEELINLHLGKIPPGVKIRVLTGSSKPGASTDRANFISVAQKFSKLPGVVFEARENNKVHDRMFFVDGQCWVMGSSIKDAAVNKPTYLI